MSDSPEDKADARERESTIEQSGSTPSGLPSISENFARKFRATHALRARQNLEYSLSDEPDTKGAFQTPPPPTDFGLRVGANVAAPYGTTRPLPTQPATTFPATSAITATWTPICSLIATATTLSVALASLPDAVDAFGTLATAFSFNAVHALEMAMRRASLCNDLGWKQAATVKAIDFSNVDSTWDSMEDALTHITTVCSAWADTPSPHLPLHSDLFAHVKEVANSLIVALVNLDPRKIQVEAADLIVVLTLLSVIPPPTSPATAGPTIEEIHAHSGSVSSIASRLGMSSAVTSTTLISVVCALLPVDIFAADFLTWNKTTHHTLVAFVSTFSKVHPDLHAAIAKLPTMMGPDARVAVVQAHDTMDSMFGSGLQPVFIMAVMIFVIVTANSPRRALFQTILQYYLVLEVDALQLLRAAVTDAAAWEELCMVSASCAVSHTRETPGYRRLSYQHNLAGFADEWFTLLELIVAAICTSCQPSGQSEVAARRLPHMPGCR